MKKAKVMIFHENFDGKVKITEEKKKFHQIAVMSQFNKITSLERILDSKQNTELSTFLD